jgi:hypothetical protein
MAGAGAQGGAFSRAMRAFSECADHSPQPVGYCHGAISSAAELSNQAVCQQGAQLNIGIHLRIPFRVLQAGTFTFRQHADYGLGSFIGVDGAEHTPGNAWGHLQLDPASLTQGDHEYEALGFEDCCDGHQELELHLNCDTPGSPWRIVVSGQTDCMSCQHTSLAAACSAAVATGDAGEAAHCGGTGGSVVCSSSAGGCGDSNSYFDGTDYFTDAVGINPEDHQFSLDFRFRSTQGAGGIQLHSGRDLASGRTDHVTFEIEATGHETFDFSTGEDPVRVSSADNARDGAWHTVTGIRNGPTQGALFYDGTTIPAPPVAGAGSRINGIDQPLYIGGQPNLMSDQIGGMGITTMTNFAGCMGGVHYEQIFAMSNSDNGAMPAGTCGEAPGVFVSGDGSQYSDCASCCGDVSGCRHCVCTLDDGGTPTSVGQNAGQFDGTSQMTYNTGVNPAGHSFVLTFSIKTTASDGIVLASSSDLTCDPSNIGGAGSCEAGQAYLDDHLVIQVIAGKLQFNFGLGSDCNTPGAVNAGQCDNTVTVVSAANINDGQWHVVRAARPGLQTAVLTIDGVTVEAQGDGPNNAIDLGTAPLYIGGHPNPASFELGLTATHSLDGCISDVYWEMDYDMPQQHCGEGAKSYNGQSYDSYPNTMFNPSANMFTISFSFKTTNDNGIIFVCGQDDVDGGYTSDHIVFEILQGQLHFDFAPGSDQCNINMHTTQRVDDGAWHTVTATRLTATTGTLRVDGVDTYGQAMGVCGASGIDLTLPVYIGGHPNRRNAVCDPTLAAAQGCDPNAGVQAGQIAAGLARQTGVDAEINFAGCLSGIRVEEEFKVLNGRGTPTPAGMPAPTEGQCAGAHDGATPGAEFTGQTYLTYNKGANPGHLMFTIAFSFKTGGDGVLVSCHGVPDNADHTSNGGDFMLVEIVGGNVHFAFSAGVDSNGVDSVVEIHHTLSVSDDEWHHVTAARTTVLGASLTVDDVTESTVADAAAHFGGIDLSQPM